MKLHWVIVMLILVGMVQSAIYRRWGQRKLTYSRSFSTDRCFAGDSIEMVEQIANRKLLPLPWLKVESLLHSGLQFQRQANLDISSGQFMQNHRSLFHLPPYTKITRRHRVVCMQRGVYRLDTVSLTCGDLLGFAQTSVRLHVGGELRVRPRPLPMHQLQLPSQSWQGEQTVQRWMLEDPFLTAGVRDYRSGDSLRAVNWKATARTGTLQVHKRDYTADHRLMILLNVEDHERMWNTVNEQERVEWSISYAAGAAAYASGQGMEVGFAVNAPLYDQPKLPVRIMPHGGQGQLNRILDTMAGLVIEHAQPFYELVQQEADSVRARTGYLVLSAFMSERIAAQLERLRQLGHDVNWIPIGKEGRNVQNISG
ncbi:DUF58 domain-containing protein [Paenibacillus sp. SYP-B4298]|uniref:DUF58 domain-containing protein n=1 Tax=Paenibacillus sp. SYP-B4298 TaxID=2996034 RepID=UPI0022DE49F2|nr:DUF58 domain-containing protein [Paenibacillus sp. SYP-B4298]